ncbi:cellulase family glycosylhydrolase [Streptomyces sp. NPDC002680]|uniref:cellulase family glycosylhydrolase n=1 Tax=Streptomyces sp. NPDC002680 TaxID=3364659 RepID=UPI0036B48AC2
MHRTQRLTRRGHENGHRSPRPLRRFVGLLLGLIAATHLAWGGAAFAASQAPQASAVPSDRMAVVKAMEPSWNLGNTLDAIPDETSWGNPPITKALLDTVKAQGFRSVRLPVTWGSHQSSTAPYTIEPAFMNRVKQVVDWAIADGLYVDLNLHHDSWTWIADMPSDHDGVLARFNATWTQIADAFRDEPRLLLFESVNEPQFNNATDAQDQQLLNELNTSFHHIVRASGGGNTDRLLLLPTVYCTPSQSLLENLSAEMASLQDDNLVATVHYYGFWPFSVNIAGYTRYETVSQQDMTQAFKHMHDIFVAKGIPVYLGEFGLLNYPDFNHPATVERGEAFKYFEQLGHEARVNGVTTALWDAFNYLNRETLQWRDLELINRIRSAWTTRSGTASSDTVYLPKSGTIGAQTLTLNPNGASFRGVWQGNRKLTQGRDYTVSGDRVTLTAAALTRLAGDRGYGANSTIQFRFSCGLPWPVHIRTYDAPVLSNASGTSSGLVVPTDFRGDELATMEARYADGSNAGTATWTSYQQFNTTFSPDYPGRAIGLTPAFLGSLTDGAPVTLTFHFWSGTTVTYQVTRSGTTVTGSST